MRKQSDPHESRPTVTAAERVSVDLDLIGTLVFVGVGVGWALFGLL